MSTTASADLQTEVDSLFWFHSFDFGGGVISKGFKSREIVTAEADAYFTPLSLEGRSVLDIGTWNGYMAFEAERRGAAHVVASDHHVWNLDWTHGRRPFDLAHRLLGSSIEPREAAVPQISPESMGQFDVVLFLGVFYHLFDAQTLTRQIAGCARDLLILETYQDALDNPRPAMIFYPGDTLNNDATNWWGPNPQCIYRLLRECGFGRIFYRDNPSEPADPADPRFRSRGIFFAFRSDDSIARLRARIDQWHDLDEAAAQTEIFSPLHPPSPPPAPSRGWRPWKRRR